MSNWRDTPIEELAISIRAVNCLKYGSEIRTAGQLAAASDAELLAIGNLGRKTLRELREVLAERPLPSEEAQLEDWIKRNREMLNWVIEHQELIAMLMYGTAKAQLQVRLSVIPDQEIILPVEQTPARRGS